MKKRILVCISNDNYFLAMELENGQVVDLNKLSKGVFNKLTIKDEEKLEVIMEDITDY